MDTASLKLLIENCQDKRVLYLEDNEYVREQTLKILHLCFKNVVVASDGEEGLFLFKNQKFDIVFTDINMPKLDGLTFIERVRQSHPTLPIVVFSAYDKTEYFLKSIQYGITGYILKPFQLENIVEILEKIIKNEILPSPVKHSIELVGRYYWDQATRTLCFGSEEVKLTQHESALFELLTSSKQKVFSSEEIEIAVFDDDFSDNKRVRNLLTRLRSKLECELIVSIYGQGYKLQWSHQ
ncbi:MAG: response regulator transcription factor [Sulfurospirillaceae bacterium]|nr:response regulator transcription factor [Sulfurospirillaceae bacterium]MDD2827001.1 response regulator transcription factor [Sulfurospirillaceae bacterium]